MLDQGLVEQARMLAFRAGSTSHREATQAE